MTQLLSNICDYINEKIAVNELSDKNYISTENMLPNKSGIVKASTLPNMQLTPAYQENDVLISNIRPYFKKIWQAEYCGGCSNDVLVLRAKQFVNPKFLYYVLSEDKFFDYATATSKGTKMPRGDKSAIMKYGVPEFSEIEQEKIANILFPIDKKIAINSATNNNLEQQIFTIFDNIFPNVRDGENTISNYFSPKRGKNLLSKNAILGDVPVIAGGLNPATYHNVANTNAPVITISASGANAGFVNLWHIPVWSSDSSYIDNTITSNIYFWYVMLKKRQQEIFDSQTGSAQPHIYPQHIEGMTVSDIDMNLVNDFNDNVTPLFINMGENIKENQKLIQLRDTLLPKLMSGEIDVSKVDISADKLLFSILVFEHFYIKIVILIGVTINEKIIITISIIVFIDRLLFCGYNKFLR